MAKPDNRWPVRTVPGFLRDHYLAEDWWTDETLGELVDRRLRAWPDVAIHIWSDTRPWHGNYAEIHADALRLAAALTDAGLEAGAVVAFQLPNWREAVVAFYGLAMGGYVLVPIVHIYGPKEVRFILGQSRALAYISAGRYGHVDYLDIVDGAAPDELTDLELHVVVGSPDSTARSRVRRVTWDVVEEAEPAAAIAPADCDEVCVLAYTSGTTSQPKGVMHSHRTLLAELIHMQWWISPEFPNLMGSPVTHATGMLGAVLAPMDAGQDIHLIDRWDPTRVLQIMLDADIGAGTGASVFLASILDHPDFGEQHAARIRRVGLGGAPVPPVLAERAAARGIAIIRAYGSSEHPSVTGCRFDDPVDKRHGTDGAPMTGVEIRLLDEHGSTVGPGEAGEIWSRGPDLCLGYTDPVLTVEAFDADGWYRSGDMGVVDAEGFLTITDRVKDVIIRGGENISASEIEEALGVLPQVAEIAAVAAPDDRLGEHVCAVVRLAPGVESIALGDLAAELERTGLARQKWPEELRIVNDFPRTPSGKVRKVDLRRQLRAEAGRRQPDSR